MCTRRPVLFLCFALITPLLLHAQPRQQDPELERILRSYRDSLGGMVNLNRIRTVRIEGTIELATGATQRITVLKKKPDSVRITVHSGATRFIQAYDGNDAWTMFERGGRSYVRMMEPDERIEFIRTAPIENVFISPRSDVTLALGVDTTIGGMDCHELIATFPDGSKQTILIDKDEFRDRRILFFDADGNETSRLLPSQFETFNGIVFAMQAVRMQNEQRVSTMIISQVDVNIGVIDTAFNYPIGPQSP
jgi:hypothetical protein